MCTRRRRPKLTRKPARRFRNFSTGCWPGSAGTGRTEFAIVRTGAYRDFGFGGFVMKRNDNVVLPSSGQAAYTGDYGAVRDFSGATGLEYVTGDMDIAIDFEDFNDGNAVQGHGSRPSDF